MTYYWLITWLLFLPVGLAEGKVLEDVAAPDKTKSLVSVVGNIDNPENPTIMRLMGAKKVVWSTTFTAKYIDFSWSPTSRYGIIYVHHLRSGLLYDAWFLLDTENSPRLYDLHFGAVEKTIGQGLPVDGDFVFGFRSSLADSTWINPHTCKFVYLYPNGVAMAVGQLILKTGQDIPTLSVVHVDQTKSPKEFDRILTRLHVRLD